jgi:hypothetical protein
MSIQHVKSVTVPDSTNTAIVRPSDWVSAHNQFLTLSGNVGSVSTVSGTNIVFAGGNSLTFNATQGTNAATIQIDGPNAITTAALSDHSHGNPSLFLTNIAGTTASNSAGLTLSLSANPGGGAGVAIGAGTSTLTSGTIVFADSNGMAFGLNGSTLTGSYTTPSQTIQPGIQSIQVSDTTYTTGQVIFSNANGISFGSSAGGAVTASYTVPAATIFSNSNNVTFGLNGSTITASAAGGVGGIAASLSGNSTSGGGGYSNITAGTLILAGGNNITLSQDGSRVTISGPNVGGAQTGISSIAGGGTTYTSGSIQFVNSNNVSFSSTTGQGFVASASYPAQTVQPMYFSASGTNTSGGTLQFGNTNGVSFSLSNGSLVATVATNYQSAGAYLTTARSSNDAIGLNTALTANGLSVTANSSGLSLNMPAFEYASHTTAFAGAGTTFGGTNVSGSMTMNSNGLALSLSAPAVGGAQTGISSIAGGGTTYTSGSIQFVNSNNVSFSSTTGQGFVASASFPAQSQQPMYFSASGTNTSGNTLQFGNTQGVSFSLSNGSLVATVATNYQSQGAYLLTARASNDAIGLNTALTANGLSVTANSSGLSINHPSFEYASHTTIFAGTGTTFAGANVSGSMTFNSNGMNLSLSSPVEVGAAVSLSGNSTSAGAGYLNISTGTCYLAGGNNITLSQNGASVTISGPNVGGAQTGISSIAGGGTTYTSGSIQFVNSYNVSFSSTTGQGFIASASYPAQTVQPVAFSASGGSSAFSTLAFNNANGFTFSNVAGAVQGSYTVPPAVSMGVSTAGNTAGTTGTVSNQIMFVGVSNVTLSQSSAAGGATMSIVAAGYNNIAAAGSTAATNATVVFSNSNGVSFGLNGATMTASVNAGVGGAAISAAGGSQSTGTVVFSNSNGVSFGFNAGTITATVVPGAAAGVAAIQNSNTTYTSGTVALSAGGGAITIASNTGQRFDFSVPATSQISVMGGQITVNTAGSTIQLSAPAGSTVSAFEPGMRGITTSNTLANGTMYFQPFVLDDNVAMYRMQLLQHASTQLTTTMSFSGSVSAGNQSSGTGQYFLSGTMGLFSRLSTGTNTNSSRLASFDSTTFSYGLGISNSCSWSTNASSATVSWTTSGAISFISNIDSAGGITTGSVGSTGSSTFSSTSTNANSFSSSYAMTFASQFMSGFRPLYIPNAATLVPGEYWAALIFSTATGSTNYSLQRIVQCNPGIVAYTTATSGYIEFGTNASTANTNLSGGWGSYSASSNSTAASGIPITNISNMSQYQTWFNVGAWTK